MADVVEKAGAVPAASGSILIVGDICGTGDTFLAAVSHVARQLGPAAIRTVALCRNSGGPLPLPRGPGMSRTGCHSPGLNRPLAEPNSCQCLSACA
jgi:hypothetical protein